MRRLTILLFAGALVAGACSDDSETEAGGPASDGLETTSSTTTTTESVASSTTEAPEPTVTDPPTTTTAPTSTTTEPANDEDDLDGMCGDWIPVVTDFGTTCVDPATVPPEPVAAGTSWTLPVVDPTIEGERWWRPPLALLNQDSVTLLETIEAFGADRITPWARLDTWGEDLRVATDGSIVVNQYPADDSTSPWYDVAVYRPGADAVVVPGAQVFHDVAEIAGIESVLIAGDPAVDDPLIEVRPLADPASFVGHFGASDAPEYGTTHVDVVGDQAVVTAWADLTEYVGYVDLGGASVDRPSPTGDLGYNQPPFVTAATFSPDGGRVTWAEGPDWDGATGDTVEAPWVVHSMDLATGETVLTWTVSEPLRDVNQQLLWSIHDLGDHIVVNFMTWRLQGWWPTQALVIDLSYEEPDATRLPIAGIAVPVPYTAG
ncbi:MAG: hypothetical protein AAGA90_04010 [Actinomycetota bacterium]